ATNVNATGGWDGTTSGIQAGYQNFSIEACVFDGVNCNAGGGGPAVGVAGQESETVNLSFDYGGGSDLTFTSFATRWQSMSVASPDGSDSMVLGPTTPIPLPAAGWLLLGGVAGLGALARRQKRKAA
ncbi:VPLPA-CTERM sorting domain-containing protein, partial [Roseovarius sp.]|uniref:VPLPA-CTERM sorting domain-containing protein n=1 Tax=Roseovarius sp. TaxID=1486281 RepID=UPI00356196D7